MPVEDILRRELQEVADGVPVPALPPLPQQAYSVRRRRLPTIHGWRQPLLVAAAVALIASGTVAGVNVFRGDETTPLPPPATSPSETSTEDPDEDPSGSPTDTPTNAPTLNPLTDEAPRVPYLLDGSLYVEGEQVSGSWWPWPQALTADAWAGQRDDDTWWWGTDPEPQAIPGDVIRLAHLSPDGSLLAVATTGSDGQVLLIDTASGETRNTLPNDATDPFGVDAVTDDAEVFLSSDSQRQMWLADDGTATIDLDAAAADQRVMGTTPAGLIVLDGDDTAYLGNVNDSGEMNQLRSLPSEEVVVNPSGSWLAFGGSFGGDSETIPEITAQSVDGSREVILAPPDEREIKALIWEDDNLLLAELYTDGTATGLARCSIDEERCVVIDVP